MQYDHHWINDDILQVNESLCTNTHPLVQNTLHTTKQEIFVVA